MNSSLVRTILFTAAGLSSLAFPAAAAATTSWWPR